MNAGSARALRLYMLALIFLWVGNAVADAATGVVELFNAQAQRPVRIDLWYPAGDCPAGEAASFCVAAGARTDKVVFVSHGALGQAGVYNWLGHGLASRGWIVAGISHYGEARVYGLDTVDAASVLRPWQRTEDVRFALDAFARNDPFAGAVGWDDVVLVGHSSGGQTAAALAGVTMRLELLVSYCASPQAQNDRGCLYSREAPQSAQATPLEDPRFAAPQRDARVTAAVLLDPALGPAATADSLRSVSVPTLVVGAADNDFLPLVAHGLRYAEGIPGARLVTLANGEGHFVFIDACSHGAEAQGVSLCRDRPGVDRNGVHEALLAAIAAFLDAL